MYVRYASIPDGPSNRFSATVESCSGWATALSNLETRSAAASSHLHVSVKPRTWAGVPLPCPNRML